jgi:Domain of unknown function (DUF4398)
MNVNRFAAARSAIVIWGSLLAGCASSPPAPPSELAVAASTLQDAERAGAAQYAPVELNRARDKAALAQNAMRQENYRDAQRLAAEAEADAKLAATKAQAAQAEQALTAVRQDQNVLRNETAPPALPAPNPVR